MFVNVPVFSTTDGDACLVTHAIVSFALPCSRQAVTMRVTFHRRRIYICAPANGGSGIDAYGWLPTTGECIVTSRIVHVAAACNDRSPVAAAGTIARTTTPVTIIRNFSASMRRDVSRADKLLDLSCARATRLIQFVRGAIAQRGTRSIDVTFVSPVRDVFVDGWRSMTDWKRIEWNRRRYTSCWAIISLSILYKFRESYTQTVYVQIMSRINSFWNWQCKNFLKV